MKRYLPLILSLWVGAAQAQMTLACQFTMGNGFTWKNGQWQPTMFNPEKPFFLTIEGGNKLEPRSALVAIGWLPSFAETAFNDPAFVKCYPAILATFSATCITFNNTIITVSVNTFEGAVSKINGATGIGEKRDQIYVMPFVCQKM